MGQPMAPRPTKVTRMRQISRRLIALAALDKESGERDDCAWTSVGLV